MIKNIFYYIAITVFFSCSEVNEVQASSSVFSASGIYSPVLGEVISKLHTSNRKEDVELIKRAQREAIDFSVIAGIALANFPHIDQDTDLRSIGWNKDKLSAACGQFMDEISNYLTTHERQRFDYFGKDPKLENYFKDITLENRALMGASEILSWLWCNISLIKSRKMRADSPDYDDETTLKEDSIFAIKLLLSIRYMRYLQPDGYCEVCDRARSDIKEIFFGISQPLYLQ